ncbi:hypothetical protein NHX12_031307 [Muraenolepis orangiensis]|uniref:PARP catalytic domain-containing protein n=1 Tax=Muraenolepis orangiensis TaxID=630683 RepID=A0A9Q0E3U2_9TELE|nr:hypothetical protein NHX12_031307 [Muraenolepis orangiensis]
MFQQQPQYSWEEDDFVLPHGVKRMGQEQPQLNQTYMYHGTSRAIADVIMREGFRQSKGGMLGRGVYLSRDLNKASRYPSGLPYAQRAVLRVEVNVGRVIAINYRGHPRQKTWHDARYGEVFDTAWCPPNCSMTKSGLEVDCVWDPNSIAVVQRIDPRRGRIPTNKMFQQQPQYSWEEDDFVLPRGVRRMCQCDQIYIMYYGTTWPIADVIMRKGFRQSKGGMLGRGVYLSRDLNKASRYHIGLPDAQRVVLVVEVNVGKVIVINYKGHPRQKTWHDARYGEVFDTAWCPPDCGMTKSGLEEDCVWDPDSITVVECIAPRPCAPQCASYR